MKKEAPARAGKHGERRRASAVTSILVVGLMLVMAQVVRSQTFVATGSLNTARTQHTATLLPGV